jgi:hypothetical protein
LTSGPSAIESFEISVASCVHLSNTIFFLYFIFVFLEILQLRNLNKSIACQNGSSKCSHGKSTAEALSAQIAYGQQVGTGEYTTGFVGGGASGSDKKVGVVGLTMFDLRRRGKVGKLSMVGVSGRKFPAISSFPEA